MKYYSMYSIQTGIDSSNSIHLPIQNAFWRDTVAVRVTSSTLPQVRLASTLPDLAADPPGVHLVQLLPNETPH